MAAEQVTIQDVETALRRIPPERLKDVLTFIELKQNPPTRMRRFGRQWKQTKPNKKRDPD